MGNALNWLQSHWALIVGTLVVVANELIAWAPGLKANSLIQFILRLQAPANKDNVLPFSK